ncbi:hypothetical protein RUM44_002000 [Polyplax serrata]|uniref:DRBM domain-containing protein n=1 Tax=Polyplax serrata TaxID=468196 RepID=A0ABR1ALM7_POLSC
MDIKTPVSMLQEHLVSIKKIPHYELIHNGVGTHNPEFVYRVRVNELSEDGKGKSKQEAKHRAAEKMLKTLKISHGDNVLEQVTGQEIEDLGENYVGHLKEFCLVKGYASPVYDVEEEAGPPHLKIFKMCCAVSKMKFYGIYKTKKGAKQIAASNMLAHLKKISRDGIDPVDDETILHRNITIIPPKKLTTEEIIKKLSTIKNNCAVPQRERIVYYKDHQRAYIGLQETSETLDKVLKDNSLLKKESPLSLLQEIVTQLGAMLTCRKIKGKEEKEITFLGISSEGDWPQISSFGYSKEDAAENMLNSLLILCTP